MEFKLKTLLPIYNKVVEYSSFNNVEYLNILKYITNNDDVGLSDYIEYIIRKYVDDDTVYNQLNIVDKFIIMLDMRIYSLGDQIQFKTEKDTLVKLVLSTIKKNIINKFKEINNKYINTINYSGIEVKLSIPKKINFLSIDSIWRDVIESIKIGDNEILFNVLNDSDKNTIETLLPANIGYEIIEFVKSSQNTINGIDLIKGDNSIGLDKISFNIYDNTPFLFIKSLIKDNLMNMYELEYVLTSKLHISYERYSKMTPNESRIFINLYNKEQKEAQDAQKKSESRFSSK